MEKSIYLSILELGNNFKLDTFLIIWNVYLGIWILIHIQIYFSYVMRQLVDLKIEKCCVWRFHFYLFEFLPLERLYDKKVTQTFMLIDATCEKFWETEDILNGDLQKDFTSISKMF